VRKVKRRNRGSKRVNISSANRAKEATQGEGRWARHNYWGKNERRQINGKTAKKEERQKKKG